MGRLRLSIQKVPRPIAGANLSTACSGKVWRRLSRQVIADAGERCAICGRRVRIQCHEKWQYFNRLGVARLVGLEALCTLCHGTVHAPSPPGWPLVLALCNPVYGRSRAFWLKRCCRINGCTPAEWKRHEARAERLSNLRDFRPWRVDLGRWADLVRAKRRKGRWLLPEGPRLGIWALSDKDEWVTRGERRAMRRAGYVLPAGWLRLCRTKTGADAAGLKGGG